MSLLPSSRPYIIAASTFEPGRIGKFAVAVLAKKKLKITVISPIVELK